MTTQERDALWTAICEWVTQSNHVSAFMAVNWNNPAAMGLLDGPRRQVSDARAKVHRLLDYPDDDPVEDAP